MPTLTPSQIHEMRSSLETEAGAVEAARALLEDSLRRAQGDLGDMSDLVRKIATTAVCHNLKIIYRHSESPIESLFLAS